MENTFHPSGQTSNSLDREIDEYFIFFLGIDALDRISFRVGYIITIIIIALVFARRLFLGIDFVFFYGCMEFRLNFVLLFEPVLLGSSSVRKPG